MGWGTIASAYQPPLIHLSAPAHQRYCRCPPTRDYHLVSLISPPLLTPPGRWIELVPRLLPLNRIMRKDCVLSHVFTKHPTRPKANFTTSFFYGKHHSLCRG